jgi:hypothetical protein
VSEANRLREHEQRWMRPSTNEHYRGARNAIQSTVRVIRASYPGVYALEDAWLTEILEYNPEEEVENETTSAFLGCSFLLFVALMFYAMFLVVRWIFG